MSYAVSPDGGQARLIEVRWREDIFVTERAISKAPCLHPFCVLSLKIIYFWLNCTWLRDNSFVAASGADGRKARAGSAMRAARGNLFGARDSADVEPASMGSVM
jgi:hypothetical protein